MLFSSGFEITGKGICAPNPQPHKSQATTKGLLCSLTGDFRIGNLRRPRGTGPWLPQQDSFFTFILEKRKKSNKQFREHRGLADLYLTLQK